MIKIIKGVLLDIIAKIDAGNSNINEEEALQIIQVLKKYTDKDVKMSKYQACEYLNISRATFDNYVKNGDIPEGVHTVGFKEKSWNKKDLELFVKNKRNKNE